MSDETPANPLANPAPRAWRWLPLALLLPAAVYLPALTAPLALVDDHDLLYVAGLTSEGPPVSVGQYIQRDMKDYGRFRPLFAAERVTLARLFGDRALALRAVPYAFVLATAALLVLAGAAMGLGRWPATCLAWLVVLNPLGSQAWIALAPQERMGMFFLALFLLALCKRAALGRGTGILPVSVTAVPAVKDSADEESMGKMPMERTGETPVPLTAETAVPRQTAGRAALGQSAVWAVVGVVAAMAAVLSKESFVMAVPGLMAAAVFSDMLLGGRTFKQALRRNADMLVALAVTGLAVGVVAAVLMSQRHTYAASLMGGPDPAKWTRNTVKVLFTSGVLLVPIILFFAAYIRRKWYADARCRKAVVLVSLGVLAWVIPTGALLAKLSDFAPRWIFPMAAAVAIANALAYAKLRAGEGRPARIAMDIGMAAWFIYCSLACVSRGTEFHARAALFQDVLAQVVASVPPEGKVLVTTDAFGQIETLGSLTRYVQSAGRGDIQLEFLDAPDAKALRTPQESESLAGLTRGKFTIVRRANAADYSAVLSMPPEEPIRGVSPESLSAQGRSVEFARHFLFKPTQPIENVHALIYFTGAQQPKPEPSSTRASQP